MFEELDLLETTMASEADVFTWDMPSDEQMAMKLTNSVGEAIFTSAVEALDTEESLEGEDMAEDEQASLEEDVEADPDEEEPDAEEPAEEEHADELGSDDYAEETESDASEQMEEDYGDENTDEAGLIFGIPDEWLRPLFCHDDIKGVHEFGNKWLWVKLPPDAIEFLQEHGFHSPEIITDPMVELLPDSGDYTIF